MGIQEGTGIAYGFAPGREPIPAYDLGLPSRRPESPTNSSPAPTPAKEGFFRQLVKIVLPKR